MPKDYTKLATDYLEMMVRGVDDMKAEDLTADRYARHGQALATLAVAWELRKLREAINGVEDALEDQDGHGVGTHLRYAAEYLEKLAKR
ncbi:hypothetical protein [Verrucosispora sioxanthis]|uniref:Uncharacterized protein n=1 Tax=Verrucosispora sioxanthis TaxID=2499994 RepID=A0A6M1L9S4_9ACTN|nr:hypothetical protein [Verrucosispora sioxanthis]NEE65905.1 hypothetical protein [Verrucosispora sioxanthis]NGM15015.1 hypothetical protein [Verrucosispora sioxanthis]